MTGRRAVAYVEVPGKRKPTFEAHEIVLGPRAGDYYLVRAGLAEGERVVTRGTFKIDSALQIEARPSMMSAALPEGPEAHVAPIVHGGTAHRHAPPAPAAARAMYSPVL